MLINVIPYKSLLKMLLSIRLIDYTNELIEKSQFLDKIWFSISFSKSRCIFKTNLMLITIIILSIVRIFSFLDRSQNICCYILLPTYNKNFEALVFHIYLLPLSAYILFNRFQMRNVHFTDFNYLKSFLPYWLPTAK